METWFSTIRHRPRLLTSAAVALALLVVLPHQLRLSTRLLVAWDVGVILYLALAIRMMAVSTLATMRERARAEDEGAAAVLGLTLAAAVASLVAIAAELRGLRDAAAADQAIRIALTIATILCSWFFVNVGFAIHYAHEHYGDDGTRKGLSFPGSEDPDYGDFLYFSFTMGAAAQTSDVVVTTKRMRRFVLAHTILAFLFNTMILALAINVGAGLL